MALGLENYPNIDPPNSDYPSGRSTDNPGNFLGTPVNLETIGDYQQFFEKMMREAGLTPNGLPDNEYNGNQLFEALRKSAVPYLYYNIGAIGQGGTNPPVGVVSDTNTITGLVWARSGTGVYTATKSGIFTTQAFVQMFFQSDMVGFFTCEVTDFNTLTIKTYDVTGSPSDGMMNVASFELRIFAS